MLLASTPFWFFSAFSLATVVLTTINSKIDYFSLHNQNSLMESTDFIWVAVPAALRKAADTEWKGRYYLKSCFCLFPRAPWRPFSAGTGLSWLHGEAGELPERPAASTGVTVRELLPWECAWEFVVVPYFFRCPWVAVFETGVLCHGPAVTVWGHDLAAWETSGLWTMRCPV